MEINKLVRQNILDLKPYSSARDEYNPDGSIMLDANENPFASNVNRYPDPYQRAVKEKVASIKQVKREQVFFGNGSDEVIDLVLRVFCEPGKDNIVITNPTYGMYEVSAGINNVKVKKAPLNDDFSLNIDNLKNAIDEQTKLVFLCSPNNPSGNLLNRKSILEFMTSFSGIVIIDEAYIDFSPEGSFTETLDQFQNLIVMQTFSKAWGMAGIRLGMAFTNPEIIDLLNKVKPPYNINALTQQFVLQKLDDEKSVMANVNEILAQRKYLIETLGNLDVVVKIFPSDSNFLLIKFKNAQNIYNYLLDKGIIVRDRSKVLYGEDCLRITVGTAQENQKLIDALKTL